MYALYNTHICYNIYTYSRYTDIPFSSFFLTSTSSDWTSIHTQAMTATSLLEFLQSLTTSSKNFRISCVHFFNAFWRTKCSDLLPSATARLHLAMFKLPVGRLAWQCRLKQLWKPFPSEKKLGWREAKYSIRFGTKIFVFRRLFCLACLQVIAGQYTV